MDLDDKIYHGDVSDLIKSVPNNSVDLVITSPPYAMKRSEIFGHNISYDEYVEWLYSLSREFMRVLKKNGSFVLNIKEGVVKGRKETHVLKYLLKMAEDGYWTDTFVWAKTNPYPTGNKKRLKDGFEYCFHFTKSSKYNYYPNNCLVPANPKWLKDNLRRSNKGKHDVKNKSGLNMAVRTCNSMVRASNVLTLATNTINIDHPATYPVGLPQFFIKLMTRANDLVMDPFMGSGTTALACLMENRNFIGFDSKKEYVDMALERIEEYKDKQLEAIRLAQCSIDETIFEKL